MTNQYGLAVDNIVAVQVVLPSGELVTASAQSNPDLFFALKVCVSFFSPSTYAHGNAGSLQ